MLLTVPSNLQTAAAQAASRPIWLAEIQVSPVLRLCSGSDLTWNTYSWAGRHMIVSRLSFTESFAVRGELVLGDFDGFIGAIALSGSGFSGAVVKLWRGDRGSPSDFSQRFTGKCGRVKGDPGKKLVTISISTEDFAWLPRRTLGPAVGATKYIPAGTSIQMGSDKYIVKR